MEKTQLKNYADILRRFVYQNNGRGTEIWQEEEDRVAEEIAKLLNKQIIERTKLEQIFEKGKKALRLKTPRLLYNLIVVAFFLEEIKEIDVLTQMKIYNNNLRLKLARYFYCLYVGRKKEAEQIKNCAKCIEPIGDEKFLKKYFFIFS